MPQPRHHDQRRHRHHRERRSTAPSRKHRSSGSSSSQRSPVCWVDLAVAQTPTATAVSGGGPPPQLLRTRDNLSSRRRAVCADVTLNTRATSMHANWAPIAEYVRALLAARKAWQRRYVRSARLSLGRESRDDTPPGITEPRTAVLCGSDRQPRWDVGVQSANRNRLCHLSGRPSQTAESGQRAEGRRCVRARNVVADPAAPPDQTLVSRLLAR